MVMLYHYTSSDGYCGIMNDGVIRSTSDTQKGAILGRGVYLTSLPPWTSNLKLLKNNWDDAIASLTLPQLIQKLECLDFYIGIDSSYLPGAKKASGKRDVWSVPHDIDLSSVPHVICVRGNNVAVAKDHGYL